jgi:chromate transporter
MSESLCEVAGSLPVSPPHDIVNQREAVAVWMRIAALSFGGPAGQIAVMHRILVEEKRWIGEERFLNALNYCMVLPGPEAHQLAVYIGWLMGRIKGGLIAGTLFVLPGLLSLALLSILYAAYGNMPLIAGLFFGLKAAVLALVLQAVIRVGKRALKTRLLFGLAAVAFAAISLFGVPFPLVVGAAGVFGFAMHASGLSLTAGVGHGEGARAARDPALIDAWLLSHAPAHIQPSKLRFVSVLVTGLAIWFAPLLLIAVTDAGPTYAAIAALNAKMAVVTFGGAYAVLAYIAQQAVEHLHWLRSDEMLVGLGFAETTPGPLISVVQFVGFMGAFRNAGTLNPYVAGTLGGLLAMWMTFVPSFLWIFLGGPYVETLSTNRTLKAALSAITAAVVGVILSLAFWLVLHTLFARVAVISLGPFHLAAPDLATASLPALALSALALFMTFRLKAGLAVTLATCCALGAANYLFVNYI